MIALALFLTIFIMEPVWSKVPGVADRMAGEISQSVAMDKALRPIRAFISEHTGRTRLFVKIYSDRPTKRSEVSTFQLLPGFAE